MAEPTSALTFSDLILEVAHKLGVAYYGAAGDQAAQIPTDTHDLDECKRIVNNAIRMFINDAPANGWRWLRPVQTVTLWPSVAADSDNTVTAVYSSPTTTLTAVEDSFYPSMELHPILLGAGGAVFYISEYVSAKVIKVTGNAAAHTGGVWAITADGNYTLGQNFGGQFLGPITFVSGTNRGSMLDWIDEASIRQGRQVTDQSGTPSLAAVRLVSPESSVYPTGTPRRRWELMMWPVPSEVLTCEFPYVLHFDKLTTTTETHPAPFGMDEAIKAACLAVAEKEKNDVMGIEWQYYREIALPNAHRADAMSAPKKLGYFGNSGPVKASEAIRYFRDSLYQRPAVTFNE